MKYIRLLAVILASGMFMTFAIGCSISSSNKNSSGVSSVVQETHAPTVTSANQDKFEKQSLSVQKQLVDYGYTDEQAETIQKLLAECGITDLSTFVIGDETNVEALVSFYDKSQEGITIWIVIDNGELYYVGYNGQDIYTQEDGVVATI